MNANTISRNTFWYGLEMGTGFIAALFTSIAIARALGPEELGQFVFVGMLMSFSSSLGSLGIPATAAKFMAEYLGRGEPGVARAVFFKTFRLQAYLSLVITLTTLGFYCAFGDRQYLTVAALLIGSNFPHMMGSIAAQANVASENLMGNVPGSLVSTFTYTVFVVLTLHFGWGLVGLGIGVMTSRAAELAVRLIPTLRRVRQWPETPLPEHLRGRMLSFSKNSVILLLLSLIVWDRSEMFFLKHFWTDARQIAFYSVAFNLTEKLQVASQVFGAATASSLMAQFGRNQKSLGSMVTTAIRYHALMAIPIHIGVAVLSAPLLLLLYGQRYVAVIPLLSIAAVLAIPKALIPPLTNGLAAKDRQALVVRWMLVTAAVDLVLDAVLIPRWGATGAVIANGAAQIFAAAVLMGIARKTLHFRLPVKQLARAGVAGLAMGAIVFVFATRGLSPAATLLMGPTAGAIVFLVMLRLTRSLDAVDRRRLEQVGNRFPRPVRNMMSNGIRILIPATSEEIL
jgi:O-antigen/teichoic acid export membrane protein